jgi:type IV secretory pathway VirB10-like protein
MADTTPTTSSGPKGVLPKHLQTWLMAGFAGIVIVVILLSGFGEKKRPAKGAQASSSPTPSAYELSRQTSEITERQKRMEAEAEQLRSQTQQLLDVRAQQGAQPTQPWTEPVPDVSAELRRKEKEREITSLYASSIAHSFRATTGAAPVARPDAPTQEPYPDQTQRTIEQQLAEATHQPGPTTTQGAQPTTTSICSGCATPRAPATNYNYALPGAHQYVMFEGTVLEAVLQNRLTSDFAGPVLCLVSTPVYSRDRQRVLVPVGSRVVGEASKVTGVGQERLAVAFHRLVMPDGYAVNLDQFTGLSAIGETALKDQVNNHYFKIFGSSILLGALSGLSLYGTQTGGLQGTSAADMYRQGVSSSLSESGARILDRFLNILPTLTIREGHRVRIYCVQDLKLPAYDDHRMPSNL